jgi:catalase
MNKLYGVHPGFRANHAKGVVVTDSFKAAPQAARLSKAVLFAGGTIPVTVRFSDTTGVPDIPDGSGLANPHGMAIKFQLPDGSETDMVLNSIKFFPVSNGADFRDMLLAVAASPPNAANPTKLDQFVAAHPAMPRALATAQNTRQLRRRRILRHQCLRLRQQRRRATRGALYYEPSETGAPGPGGSGQESAWFLVDELAARLAQAPVNFA